MMTLYMLVKSTIEDGVSDAEALEVFKDSSPEIIQLLTRAAHADVPVEKEPFLAWLKEDEKQFPDK